MNTRWEDAIKRGDLQVIESLLEQGADVNARDRYGQTALMLAARAGDGKAVKHSSRIRPSWTSLPSLG